MPTLLEKPIVEANLPTESLVEPSEVIQEERMVSYHGNQYPESQLRDLCPHLANLGDLAFKLIVEAHIIAEAALNNVPLEEEANTTKKEPGNVHKSETKTAKIIIETLSTYETTQTQTTYTAPETPAPAVQPIVQTAPEFKPEAKPTQKIIEKEEVATQEPKPIEPQNQLQEIVAQEVSEIIIEPVEITTIIEPVLTSKIDLPPEPVKLVAIKPVPFEAEETQEPESNISQEITPEPESPTVRFEEFITELPEPETPPTLETVQESANNMPVEETLASLVSVIELSPPQQTEELRQIIAEAYEAVCLDIETIESGNIILSPEATEKVITLLSYIGYENAEEALEQLLESKNEEFLLHALGYLNQIVNKDTEPEFWQRFTNNKMYALPSQTRFGKMLLQILGVQKLALN